MDTLRHGHNTVARGIVDLLDVLDEFWHTEIRLRQIDQIRTCAVFAGQGGSCGQPTGMTAHDLHHHDHALVVHMCVLIDLHNGGSDVLGGRGVAGAMIRAEQIVVNGLGHAHNAALVAHRLHILVDLIAGVHGVVAAVIEEIAYIVLLEDLKDALVVRIVQLRIGDLIAAGAQCGGGGILQQAQLLGILLPHVEQPIVKYTHDAVLGTQHLGNGAGLQRRVDHAVGTGIDNGSGAAGLTDNTRAAQFFHIRIPPKAEFLCLQRVFYHVE